MKAEFVKQTKLNPEFTRAMTKMFKVYKSMSFAEKVRYIETRKPRLRAWVEPTRQQEGLF